MTSSNALPVRPSLAAVLTAFALIYIIWGSTYLAIRFAVETIPPFTMAGVRFLFAGAILYAWSAWRGAGRPTRTHWRSAAVIGTLLLVTGNGLVSWAEQYVASGVAALIVATVPMWMVLLESLRPGGSRPSIAVIFGLILGMVGIVILISPAELGGEPVHVPGALVICFAALCWAVGSIYSRGAPQSSSTLQNVGMQMLTGGAILVVAGLALGERTVLAEISARSIYSLIYLSLIGGVVGYTAYVWLLKVSTPAKVSTYAYINPVVAVLLGWALAGESMGLRVLAATATVVSAVILIVRKKKTRKAAAPPPKLARSNV
ncbi:MAG: EamA family transporter [Acidobacteriota bacterium]